MKHRKPSTVALIATLLAGAIGLSQVKVSRSQPAPAAVVPKPVPLDAAKMEPITGGTSRWKLTERRAGQTQMNEVEGRPVLITETFPVTLTSEQAIENDSDISIRFRMTPQDKAIASIGLQTALADGADLKDAGMYFNISTRGDTTTAVNWSAVNTDTTPGPKRAKSGGFAVGYSASRSLDWSEGFRRLIEADVAAADTVGKYWFTLTAVIRNNTVEFLLDGIPITRAVRAPGNTAGFTRLSLSPNVQVASLTVRKLAAENPQSVYRPISLLSVFNSNFINGKRLTAPVVGGRPLHAGAVPFTFTAANDRQQNHVDIGTSWLRQGNQEGGFAGDRDAFGGRWPSVVQRDPARIRLRVPRGRYRALHLLAVSDNESDSVPVVTAQFYKPGAGFPVSFVSPTVPRMGARGKSVAVKRDGGGTASLHHIVIPLDPGALAAFDDQEYFEMELTKQVQTYRAYPDPVFYSVHGAGLPSSVRVFAATLEQPAVEVELKANAYGHVWTAPLKPEYSVKLTNRSGTARPVELTLATTSYWGNSTTSQKQMVQLGAPGQEATTNFKIDPLRNGYHDLKLTVKDGAQVWEETRSFAYLHEETRERGDWDFGKGPLFGFYNWAGGHGTPNGGKQLLVMGQAGAETMHSSFDKANYDEEGLRIAEKYKVKSYKFAGAGDHYVTLGFADQLSKLGLETARANFLKTLSDRKAAADSLHDPRFLSFYAEPSVGYHTLVPPGDYYNAPPLPWSEAEIERYNYFFNGFMEGAKIVRENFPGVKNLLPHGDPNFAVPFLRRNPEIARLIDGVTVDIPAFERLPEQQMHQVAVHRMYVSRTEFRKAGIEKPLLPMYEGPCLPTGPGALTQPEMADLSVRNALILFAYGIDMQTGGFPGFDCTSPWGEQHYGYGAMYRIPFEMPKPAYAAYATMTRQLNRSNFDGWEPTGSLSAFALRFKHYKTGKLVHAMWTIRGTRTVNIPVPAGSAVTITDAMDNATTLPIVNGLVSFQVSSSPVFVSGLPVGIKIGLGEPNHSDAKPAAVKSKLTNFGDGTWKLSTEPDEGYEKSHYPHIARFPGNMTIAPNAAPVAQGGKALAVQYGKQEVERMVMPHYTTLTPSKPIAIPGKSSHLGLWVRAASDWGRVIYSLRDAKGERWMSVGKAGAWNCDDLHSWSHFNFDGWRYLRFETPSNCPYDSFRELGSTWWGSYSSGDGNIDLPLSLEKVIIERRSHAVYVNDLQPTRHDDVLLGDLFAEYARPQDQGKEAIRLASLRMPVPSGVPELDNPIEKMAQASTIMPVQITQIKLPAQASDGTQCYVFFDTHPDAVSYDIWASPYPNGHGALQLAKGWKEPGGLVRGFRPDTDFYLFATYTDKDGKVSKPSAPFKIHLLDLFAQK